MINRKDDNNIFILCHFKISVFDYNLYSRKESDPFSVTFPLYIGCVIVLVPVWNSPEESQSTLMTRTIAHAFSLVV